MKNQYVQETVDVTCTDTQVTLPGNIIGEKQNQIRVDMGGVVLTFYRQAPGFYVANSSGLEFTFRL